MLHGVSAKLSRLNDVAEIGATIADELRLLIDYHNCRVFVREGDDLRPIAFRGDLSASGSAMDVLATRVGDGITGHVAATGEPFLTGDAAHCEIGVHIPGTDEIEESLLAVPFLYGPTVVGVIVVSKLGLDQFDSDDLRLLEVLAGHVSVALVNARLYEAQRREAESAKALLELTRELSAVTNLDGVLRAGRAGGGADHGLAPLLGLAADARRRARVPRRPTGDAAVRDAAGSRARPGVVARCSARSEPFVVDRARGDCCSAAPLDARELATPHAVAFIPLDQGLAALAVETESDSTDASSSCSPGSRARHGSRSRTPGASRPSSGRSSRPSRRSPTRSRPRTRTRPRTRAGSATWRSRSARSSVSTRRG